MLLVIAVIALLGVIGLGLYVFTSLKTITGNITTLQTRASSMGTSLTALQTSLTTLGNSLTTLQGLLTTLGNEYTTLQGDLASLQALQASTGQAINTELTNMQTSIGTIQNSVTVLQDLIGVAPEPDVTVVSNLAVSSKVDPAPVTIFSEIGALQASVGALNISVGLTIS